MIKNTKKDAEMAPDLAGTRKIVAQRISRAFIDIRLQMQQAGIALLPRTSSRGHIVLTAAAALFGALFLSSLITARNAYPATQTRDTTVKITANVQERTSMQVLNQIPALVITNTDVMRGYVDVGRGTRINVRNNNTVGYLLVFEVLDESAPVFRSLEVLVDGKAVQLPLSGGWIPQPYIRGGGVLDISYRFVLSKEAKSGTYTWPVIVSVQSM